MLDKLEFTSAAVPENAQETPAETQKPASAAQVYEDLVALSKKTEKSRENILLKGYAAAVTCLGAAVILLAVALTVAAIGWNREQGTIVPEVVEVEKEVIVEVPAITIIEPSEEYNHALASDRYLLNDANYGPIWMPLLDSVPKNTYDPALFAKDELTGKISYNDGTVYSVAGIDVSVYQGEIDWQQVKDSGVEFVIIRCGNRGYVTGSLNEDVNFRHNIEGALNAGLDVGVYYFSQAVDMQEALDEAEFIIDLLDGYELTLPVFYDWEVVIDPDGDAVRASDIDPDLLTSNFLVFAQRLELEGYEAAVYANKKTAVWKYDLSRLDGYDIWYAEYSDVPTMPYDFAMWQYSSKGAVPGINGNVDLNIRFKRVEE